jgi:selenocysteine lyase/cysteine desulfurase
MMDYRKEFAEFGDVTYLDVCAQAPMPLNSARAAHTAVDWKKLPHTIPEGMYFDLPDRVRNALARLIGAEADEIGLATGASTGFSIVANGMDWHLGDEIVVAEGEFPAHFSAWMGLETTGAARVKLIKPSGRFIAADDYISALGPRVRLVSASLVRFDNAARLEVDRVAEACHAAGAALLLDMSQCVGGIPLDMRRLGADFATASGYKWLLSPYGTGFFWIRRDWQDRLRPAPVYWMALEGAKQFHELPLENLRASHAARRWDMPETANFTNLAAMDASLEFLQRINPATVENHNRALIGELIESLPRDRCVLASPPEPERRGPFICVTGRTAERTKSLYERLRAEKIFVSYRQGVLRISPHLYNTANDIRRLISVLSV